MGNDFSILPVGRDEIVIRKSRWQQLTEALLLAFREDTGVFVAPFTRKDTQNYHQSARRELAKRELTLHVKGGTRGGEDGYYLWFSERDPRPLRAKVDGEAVPF